MSTFTFFIGLYVILSYLFVGYMTVKNSYSLFKYNGYINLDLVIMFILAPITTAFIIIIMVWMYIDEMLKRRKLSKIIDNIENQQNK